MFHKANAMKAIPTTDPHRGLNSNPRKSGYMPHCMGMCCFLSLVAHYAAKSEFRDATSVVITRSVTTATSPAAVAAPSCYTQDVEGNCWTKATAENRFPFDMLCIKPRSCNQLFFKKILRKIKKA